MLKKIAGWATGLDAIGQCALTCAAIVPLAAAGYTAVGCHFRQDPATAASFRTGVSQLAAKDYAAADASFASTLAVAPDYPEARHYHARTLASLGRYDDALRDALTAETTEPENASIRVLVGYIYFALRDYPRSDAELAQALALEPNNKLALFTRAQSQAYQHRYGPSADDLERVLAVDPVSRKARFLLAGVYSRMSDRAGDRQLPHADAP